MGKENVDNFMTKRRDIIIKFRSMADILNKYGAWFDGHGNLCVANHRTADGHLAPSYFHLLGKTVETKSHHSYPDWCIERQYDDLFYQNMALRHIASGKLSPERMIEVAQKSVLIK
jgi:hypothetical protein